jgi:hypothetical protein
MLLKATADGQEAVFVAPLHKRRVRYDRKNPSSIIEGVV